MIAELTLRSAGDAADPGLFDAVVWALDEIGRAGPERTRDAALGGAWRILGELGIAPTIDTCSECHASIDPDAAAVFSHRAGGALCDRCGGLARTGRTLPPTARAALRDWLGAGEHALAETVDVRAHQRLLREFLREHLPDDRPLSAFDSWERGALDARPPATAGELR